MARNHRIGSPRGVGAGKGVEAAAAERRSGPNRRQRAVGGQREASPPERVERRPRHRRVLIAASGFYEWHRPPKGSNEKSTPYWIKPKQGGIVAFGGLMETYMSADGAEIDTAAVLTTGPNKEVAPIHNRMPVVIRPEDFSRWLDCLNQEPRHVADLMAPATDDYFEAIRVSDLVNKVANSGPEVQKPAPEADHSDEPAKPAKRTAKAKAADAGADQMKLF